MNWKWSNFYSRWTVMLIIILQQRRLTPILILHQSHHTSSWLFLCHPYNSLFPWSFCRLIVEPVPHHVCFCTSTYFLWLSEYFELIFFFLRVHLPFSVLKCFSVRSTENLRALTAWPKFTYDSYACLDSKSN